jgi:hypothetical protein
MSDMPFAEDSPPPLRAPRRPLVLLHKTSFTRGPSSPLAPLRSRHAPPQRAMRYYDENDDSDLEYDWADPEDPPRGSHQLGLAGHNRPALRPQASLADLQSCGVRPRIVTRASLPALRAVVARQAEVVPPVPAVPPRQVRCLPCCSKLGLIGSCSPSTTRCRHRPPLPRLPTCRPLEQ